MSEWLLLALELFLACLSVQSFGVALARCVDSKWNLSQRSWTFQILILSAVTFLARQKQQLLSKGAAWWVGLSISKVSATEIDVLACGYELLCPHCPLWCQLCCLSGSPGRFCISLSRQVTNAVGSSHCQFGERWMSTMKTLSCNGWGKFLGVGLSLLIGESC